VRPYGSTRPVLFTLATVGLVAALVVGAWIQRERTSYLQWCGRDWNASQLPATDSLPELRSPYVYRNARDVPRTDRPHVPGGGTLLIALRPEDVGCPDPIPTVVNVQAHGRYHSYALSGGP
jgi:hypothetical protein